MNKRVTFCVSKTIDFEEGEHITESFHISKNGDGALMYLTRDDILSLKKMIDAAILINEEEERK